MDKNDIIEVKPVINKKNKQITISLPKKAMSKRVLNDIHSKKRIGIMFIGRKFK